MKMQTPARGLVVAVPQQPADYLWRHALPGGEAGEGVAEVVDVTVGDLGLLADLTPEHPDTGQVAGGEYRAGKTHWPA